GTTTPGNDDGTPDQGSGDAPGTPTSGTTTPGNDDGTPDQGSGDAPGTPGSGGSTGSSSGTGTRTVVPETENNDSKSSANRFTMPASGIVQLSGVSTDKDDKDFFRFTADRNAAIDVHLANVGRAIADLEIEDSSGTNLLELEPGNGTTDGQFQVRAGQTYYIRLRATKDTAATYLVDLVFGGI
ncbi:MAG: hypothetical protein KDA60_22390, partial [Planctomycetales bacterium]|nr:hypothetical protein [Planctomycetales bacterium]